MKASILRHPESATKTQYDVIIVGGGIHGACALLDAARRGLRALLLERDDFGGATSWNSLRILHGGLRYLQHMDVRRFRESVGERRWFCQNFPDLVRPLPCLLPLYGRGLKRPGVFRFALVMNDWLARRRNVGVVEDLWLPASRLLSPQETVSRFPLVDRQNLCGAALWYDVAMLSPQRILIEIIRWACSLGATALNYVEASHLATAKNEVAGVIARDRVSARHFEFRAPAVLNCAGPWCRQVAEGLDRDVPALFKPSLAFNLLLSRTPLSNTAIAIQARRDGAPVFFTYPFQGRALVGTYHAPQSASASPASVPEMNEQLIDAFISELNLAVAEWCLQRNDVLRVFPGLLPAQATGSLKLARREVIYNHEQHGGPHRLVSLCGVKFTTARLVTQQGLNVLLGQSSKASCRMPSSSGAVLPTRQPARTGLDVLDAAQAFSNDDHLLKRGVRQIVQEEAVIDVDDLIYRRTDWGLDPRNVPRIRERLVELLAGQDGPLPSSSCACRI